MLSFYLQSIFLFFSEYKLRNYNSTKSTKRVKTEKVPKGKYKFPLDKFWRYL